MDGSTFATSSYPNLAALCGPYQLGNENSGQTRLPDFRGRLPIGSQNSATGSATYATAWPLGYKNKSTGTMSGPGNEEAHVQLSTEMATHSHSIDNDNHYHVINDKNHSHNIVDQEHVHTETFNTGGGGGTGGPGPAPGPPDWQAGFTTPSYTGITQTEPALTGLNQTQNASTGISIVPKGSSNPFNIVPPVVGINWFVKHD